MSKKTKKTPPSVANQSLRFVSFTGDELASDELEGLAECLTGTVELKRNVRFIAGRGELAEHEAGEEGLKVYTATFYSGEKVLRYDYWDDEEFFLELSTDPEDVNLEPLSQTGQILDTHQRGARQGVDSILGSVVEGSPRIEDGKVMADFILSPRDDLKDFVTDVDLGIARAVSMGFDPVPNMTRDVTQKGEATKTLRVDAWAPREISFVPVGAATGARVNQSALLRSVLTPEGKEKGTMASKTKKGATAATEAPKEDKAKEPKTSEGLETTVDVETTEPAATAAVEDVETIDGAPAERFSDGASNEAKITRICAAAGKDASFVQKHLEAKTSPEELSNLLLRELAGKEAQTVETSSKIVIGREERDTFRDSVAGALLNRFDPSRYDLPESGRHLNGMSLMEIARECAESAGSGRGLSKRRLLEVSFAHSTSDFPDIISNVLEKSLAAGMLRFPSTYTRWAKRGSLPNYKAHTLLDLGDAPRIKTILEGGEFTKGTIGEGKETIQLVLAGRIFGINETTLVNDDLDAFTRVPELFGASAEEYRNEAVYTVLTANGDMGDGTALFHADHGNLASVAAAPTVTTLSAARLAMRIQKGIRRLKQDTTTDVEAQANLNVQARFILIPAAHETVTQQVLAPIQPATSTTPNPFTNSLEIVVDPFLDTDSADVWYLAADSSIFPTVLYASLDGNDGIDITTREGFETAGIDIRAKMSFGAAAENFRGLFKNPGA